SVNEDVRSWADLTGTAAEIPKRLAEGPGGLFGRPCEKRRSSAPDVKPISVCGASPLWNAIHDAAGLAMRDLAGSKALLLLTGGFDSGSSYTWREAADEAHRADVSVYAIQYRSASGRNFAPDLYRLAAESGGTSFRPPNGDYRSIVSRIEADLRRRYVLVFRP